MKPITVHPMSALAGAGVLALVLLGTGIAAPQGGRQRTAYEDGRRTTIETFRPQSFLVIRQGTPYTVPDGKHLIVTALGATNTNTKSGYTALVVNEVTEVFANALLAADGAANGTTMTPLPAKFYVPGGAVVSAQNSREGAGRAWGYLVDA